MHLILVIFCTYQLVLSVCCQLLADRCPFRGLCTPYERDPLRYRDLPDFGFSRTNSLFRSNFSEIGQYSATIRSFGWLFHFVDLLIVLHVCFDVGFSVFSGSGGNSDRSVQHDVTSPETIVH